jgi:hypothetical protein
MKNLQLTKEQFELISDTLSDNLKESFEDALIEAEPDHIIGLVDLMVKLEIEPYKEDKDYFEMYKEELTRR